MLHKSVNIRDEVFEKFQKYQLKEPVNFTDTVNMALEKFLDIKLKRM